MTEVADASRLLPVQVIPLVITDGNGTEIMEGKATSVIGVRYEILLDTPPGQQPTSKIPNANAGSSWNTCTSR